MSIDSFDPRTLNSAQECLEKLQEQGIKLGHRMGARIFGLSKRGILFSYAFLEELSSSESLGELFKNSQWNVLGAGDKAKIQSLLKDVSDDGVVVSNQGFLFICTPDEVDSVTTSALPALQGSLLPSVLGSAQPDAIKGLLWDRKRMEEAALILLDNENNDKIIEAFRYLFRAAVSCGQDPLGLLVTALKRGRSAVSKEAANLVRDNLDRDFGRALEGLLTEDPVSIKDALHFFSKASRHKYISVLRTLLLPALIPLINKPGFRSSLLPGLPQLAPLIGYCLNDPDTPRAQDPESSEMDGALETFLDNLLADLPELDLSDRFSISAFIVDLAPLYNHMTCYLIKRMQNTVDPNLVAFFGNILARMPLERPEKEKVTLQLIELFKEHGGEVGINRRLRVNFKHLGCQALKLLSAVDFVKDLNEEQILLIIYIWKDFRQTGIFDENTTSKQTCSCNEDHHHNHNCCQHEDILSTEDNQLRELLLDGCTAREMNKVFADFAVARLEVQDRTALLALLHSEQLNQPCVYQRLNSLGEEKDVVLSYLLDQVWHLEEPNNTAVLTLLAKLDLNVLDHSFSLVRKEAALESGGEASRVVVFGKLANRMELNQQSIRKVQSMVKELLSYSYYNKSKLPVVWTGLGEVGCIKGLGGELQKQVVDKISENLEKFPEAKLEALTKIYPASSDKVRRHIENILREVITSPNPERKLLRTSLLSLEQLLLKGPILLEPESLIAALCRTVLAKEQGTNLENLMMAVLAMPDDDESDGVQIPGAWNQEDRDTALRILGNCANHKEATPNLRRLIIFRLFSFLEDWLEAVEKGENLYLYRDTPLWEILCTTVEKNPDPITLQLAAVAAVRLIEDHHKKLEGIALERRENAQRFLAELVSTSCQDKVIVRGITVDLRQLIVSTLIDIAKDAPPENTATAHLLKKIGNICCLTKNLQAEIKVFLKSCNN